MSSGNSPTFKLSTSLQGHSQDVKALCPSGNTLLSASRDATVRSWNLTDPTQVTVYSDSHSGFVNAVHAYTYQGQEYVLSAGADSIIYAWPAGSTSPSNALIGHMSNVCCLSSHGDVIVSGSWDKTVKIWRNWECIATLEGHGQAVWDVIALEDGVLTACADNLIRYFVGYSSTSDPAVIFKGHTQPVRSLAKLSGSLFVSGANDGSIRVWDLSTQREVQQLDGHDSFVYSVAALPSGEIISGGEDRSMRVWSADSRELLQTITLPAISVWSVTAMPSGDIAAGTSDGVVRVFSRAVERQAEQALQDEFDATLSATALNAHQIGDVKKTDLPGPEALYVPGKKEGETKMIKNADGSVDAHQWSVGSGTWTKIGTVVDAVSNGRRQLYNGEEYDHVFDVDVHEGAPPLKLPYNVTQNPYEAAQKFLQTNELPLSYLDEVVKFIEKNTAGVQLGSGGSGAGDPYTGGGAYRPGNATSSQAQPAQQAPKPAPSGSNVLPYTSPLTFTQANLPAAKSKILQVNGELANELSSEALQNSQINTLDELMASLLALIASPPGLTGAKLPHASIQVAEELLAWPSARRFPCLDLFRLLCLFSAPSSASLQNLLANTGAEEINAMLALRALANTFNTRTGAVLMKQNANTVLATLQSRRKVLNKNGKIAAATVLLNYSVLAVQRDLDKTVGPAMMDLAVEYMQESDPEVIYRSLVVVGNLLHSPNVIGAMTSSSIDKLKKSAADAARKSSEPRADSLIEEINRIVIK